ncbi:hypothetical protein [Clostridium magnum]|uniref:hypothetical protein n=1 Tax=Clostridium magnum TaxID=33954 RepID=UPI00091AED3F|nr:hypothetical protein [Clostridium magnum]SHJ13368.1 hypothetical protein SAMN02745944_05413 [Clostridium magnum DSM 2767]
MTKGMFVYLMLVALLGGFIGIVIHAKENKITIKPAAMIKCKVFKLTHRLRR